MLLHKIILVSTCTVAVLGQNNRRTECTYSADCKRLPKCDSIQDASCFCNRGKCVIEGNPFFRDQECDDYTQCDCRNTPLNCFCKNGSCKKERWECHAESDCKRINKCRGKDCRCSSANTCEPYDCYETADCIKSGHSCTTYDGLECSCNEYVCDITLPEQAAVDFPPQPPPLTNGDEFPSPPPKSGLIFPPAPPPLRNQGGSPPAPPPLRNGGDFPPAPPAPPVRSGEDFPPPPPLLFEGGVEFLPGRSNDNSCKFTVDCKTVRDCIDIQDASCVCKQGECIPDGNPFFRGTECDKYTDCSCRNKPEKCFCRNGFCVEENWECHEPSDCKKIDKCKDINCRCSYYDTCEPYECVTTSDCFSGGFQCIDKYEGYTCNCEENVCALKPIDPTSRK